MALTEWIRIHLPARIWGLAASGSVATVAGVVSAGRREVYGQVWRITVMIAEIEWERLFPILEKAVQMLFVVAVLALGVWAWAVTRKTRLKNKMVERGFTASEIEDVMKS